MDNLVGASSTALDVSRLCFPIPLFLVKPQKLNVVSQSSCLCARVHSRREARDRLNRLESSAYSFDDGCTDSECELSSDRDGISDTGGDIEDIEQQYDVTVYHLSEETSASSSNVHTVDSHQDCTIASMNPPDRQWKTDRTIETDPSDMLEGSECIPERNIRNLPETVRIAPNEYAEWMPDSKLQTGNTDKDSNVHGSIERLYTNDLSECSATNEGKAPMGNHDRASSEDQSEISLHLEDVMELESKWPCEGGIEMGENGEAVVKVASVRCLQEEMSVEDMEQRNKTGWSETSCDDGSILKARRTDREQQDEEQEMEKLAQQEEEVFIEDVGKTPDDYHRRADIFELSGEAFIAEKMREEARNHIEMVESMGSQQHEIGADSST